MRYCEKCRVHIRGDRSFCPLCQQAIDCETPHSGEVYPHVPPIFGQYSRFFRWCAFLAIVAATVCVAINIMVPTVWWSVFVIGAIVSLGISLCFAIIKRKHFIKNILYQVVIVSVICILWDVLTTWRGWSIDYVTPIVCVAAMAAMGIISKVQSLKPEDYVIYLIIDGLFGIVPMIFLLTGIVNVVYPSIICVVVSLISLSALLIFSWKDMVAEVKRRFHI